MSNVQSIERAFTILEILSKHPKGIKLTEIAAEASLSKGTVHRLLATLLNLNYVRQDQETERYRMGYQVISLATHFLDDHDLITSSRPHLLQLSQEINETVHLCIEDNGMALYIDKIESTQPIAMYSRVGSKAPMYCTAVGKMMLAGMDHEKYETVVSTFDFKKLTPYTIDSVEKLTEEIKRIKDQSYAIDDQEITEGVRCIACPIYDFNQKTIGSFSVSGPMNRISYDFLEETLILEVRETAARISREFGWKG